MRAYAAGARGTTTSQPPECRAEIDRRVKWEKLANASLEANLAVYAKRIGRTFKPVPLPEAGLFFRSDHFPFAKVGVPAVSLGFDASTDLLKGETTAGRAWHKEFVGKRYRQPDDEWNPDWDLSGVAEDVGLILELSKDVANSNEWPSWNEGSEFKAVRDAAAVERL